MDGGAHALRELARYCAGESDRWREWLAQQPAAVLEVEVGEEPIGTVGALLAHIAGVELIYADALMGVRRDSYQWPASDSAAEIFGVHEDAFDALGAFLDGARDAVLAEERTLRVPGRQHGWTLTAPAGKMVAHMLVHGIRHYAQIASALRRAGHPQPWPHDLIAEDGFGPAASFSEVE